MRLLILLLLVASASPVLARTECTSEPRDKWISEAEMKAKIATMGQKADVFKVTKGNCYEIYGRDSSGERIEIYFNPVTGKPVPKTAE